MYLKSSYQALISMKKTILIFTLFALVQCEDEIECGHQDIAVSKEAPFIRIDLKVLPVSVDSILLKTTITNNWENDFALYKPLLPNENLTEELVSVMEKTTYKNLTFTTQDKEGYLTYDDGGRSNYIKPRLTENDFIVLKPQQTIEVQTNIASKFDFKRFLKKGQSEFMVVYSAAFPYVVNNRQFTEMDKQDSVVKPVYYYVGLKSNDPDLGRVAFKVPSGATD